MDLTIRYRLLLAKRFFENARASLVRSDMHSAAVAIVSAHDALDNLLGALATHLGVHLKDDLTMLRTYDTIGAAGHSLGSRVKLDQLNALRVDAKHRGLHPHPAIARELISEIRVFADDTMRKYFGQTLSQIRLVDAVDDEPLRMKLAEVENVIEAGDYPGALSRMAFIIFDVFERRQLEDQRFVRVIGAFASRRDPEHPKFEFPEFEKSQLRLDLLELGISPEEYDRFHFLVPQVGLRPGSDTAYIMKKSRYLWHEENWTLTNVELAFDFLLRLVLAKQERPTKNSFVRHHPLDKLTFARDVTLNAAFGTGVVGEFHEGDEVFAIALPYVDGAWQNFGEDTVRTWIYFGSESGFATILKNDVIVTPDVEDGLPPDLLARLSGN